MARNFSKAMPESEEPSHRQSEGFYRTLFHESRDTVYITTRDGDLVDMNPAGCRLLGIEPSELHQHNAGEFYADAEDRKQFQQQIEAEGEVRDYEVVLKRTDGHEMVCLLTSIITRDADGQVSGYQGLIRDVSEIRAAEQASRNAHAELKATLESIPDLTFVVTGEGTILEVHSMQEIGVFLDPAEVIGKRIEDILPSESAGIILRSLADAIQGGRVSGVHYSLELPDGLHWYELSAAVVRGEQSEPNVRLIATTRDITDRIRMEEALTNSEQRFRSMFEGASIGIAIADIQGRPQAVNAAYESLMGYSADELRGKGFPEFTHPDDLPDNLALWERLVRGELHQYDLEKRYLRKDGTQIPVALRVSRFPGGGDDSEFAIVMVEDVTERKRAEQAEREQRTLAEALRDTAEVLSSTLDLDEIFELILQHAARVVPHDFADILLFEGNEARIIKSRGYPAGHLERLATTRFQIDETPNLQTMVTTLAPIIIDDVHDYEGWFRNVSPLTAEQTRSYLGAPIYREDRVVGAIGLLGSVPGFFLPEHAESLMAFANQAGLALHNANLYQQLAEYTEELAARNHELDAFSYTVAHDLKSPLQIVLGYSAFLLETLRDEMAPSFLEPLESIRQYATQMNHLIESLLLMAQLGRDHPHVKSVDLQAITHAANTRVVPMIEERGVEVTLPNECPSVLAYEPWIEDVIANLLENAVKYIGEENPTPAIEVHAVVRGNMVRYEVRDNGIGIPATARSQLFHEFVRFHPTVAHGSGLGLSIVRRIITKLGGEVGADDIAAGGTCFWFTLPAA